MRQSLSRKGISPMKRPLAAVMAILAVLTMSGTAMANHSGTTTINLRAWAGTMEFDGVQVCLQGGHQDVCAVTEDGEFWVDSLPHGAYRASVEAPPGYHLAEITCTTFGSVPYSPCRPRASEVRFVVQKGFDAVSINFYFVPNE